MVSFFGFILISSYIWLVVWNMWIVIFPSYWECHHPNWRTHIFQRGRYTTNQIWLIQPESNDGIVPSLWKNTLQTVPNNHGVFFTTTSTMVYYGVFDRGNPMENWNISNTIWGKMTEISNRFFGAAVHGYHGSLHKLRPGFIHGYHGSLTP